MDVLDQPAAAGPADLAASSVRPLHAGEAPRRSPRKLLVLLIVALAVIIAGTAWWRDARKYEETDDAQVDGHIYPISARISGHLAAVLVDEGELVEAGAVLVKIDPVDYRVAADRARAEYEDAVAEAKAAALVVAVTRVGSASQISSAEAALEHAATGVSVAMREAEQEQAKLDAARSTAETANRDVRRYAELLDKHEIAEQEYDKVATAADGANADVVAAEAAVRAATEAVTQARSRVRESQAALDRAHISPKSVAAAEARSRSAEAKVARARAALEQATLNLGYTKIVAPVAGIVGRRAAQVGQNVEPGEDLLAIVPLDDVWITANYKEDQLALMRPGQEVSIDVDAYGREWHGTVTSIGGATGARYSILPPENATGNYVKVVQRIPVRIDLGEGGNAGGLLRPGMSVVPSVRVR